MNSTIKDVLNMIKNIVQMKIETNMKIEINMKIEGYIKIEEEFSQ